MIQVISTEDLHPRVHRMHTRTTRTILRELERGHRDAIRYYPKDKGIHPEAFKAASCPDAAS